MRFPAPLELEYLHSRATAETTTLRWILGCAIGAFAGNFLLRLLLGQLTSGFVVDVAVVGVLGAFMLSTRTQRFDAKRHLQAVVVNYFFIAVIVILMCTRPAAWQLHMVGLVHLQLLVNVMMPYGFLSKIPVSLVLNAAYFLTIVALGGWAWPAVLTNQAVYLAAGTFNSLLMARMLESRARRQFLLQRQVDDQRERSDALLYLVLPRTVADRLKDAPKGTMIVNEVPMVGILFADIVGFTKLAATRPAAEVAGMLNDLFSRFDVVTARLGAQKIKTIGDAYMAVAGIPDAVMDPAGVIATLALELRSAVERYRLLTGLALDVRIGIHCGPVAAGVIGRDRFQYDLWGDSVNLASRLEATALPGRIHASAAMAQHLDGRFLTVGRGATEIKGLGEMETFFVEPGRASQQNTAAA